MAAPIDLNSLLAFVAYLGTGLVVLVAAVLVVALVTPHKEFTLVRQGNTAAAIALAGSMVGIALPVHAAISNSVSIIDALIWGVVAAVVQVLAYLATRIISPQLSRQITDNVTSVGVLSAGVAISVGLVNAAAMTP